MALPRSSLLLLALAACSRSITGPAPSVTSTQNPREPATQPGVVCNAQKDPNADGWLMDVLGDGFAPLPINTLKDNPGVYLPAVQVGSYTVPDARVQFADVKHLRILMTTRDTGDANELAPGAYPVTVTNPNGHTVTVQNMMQVVPPPHITQVAVAPASGGPAGTSICANSAQTLTVTGTNFRAGANVSIASHTFQAASVTPTLITVNLPANTFTASETSASGATVQVTVHNPEGCLAPATPDNAALAQLKAYPACNALGTLAVSPRFAWQQQNTPITITDTFTPGTTQPFSGALPTIVITAPVLTASGPGAQVEDIPLRRIAFVGTNSTTNTSVVTAVVPSCSGLAATPTSAGSPCIGGIAPGGPYDIRVTDPANGTGTIVGRFFVVANQPPQVTGINPSSITTQGGTMTVTGAHFDVSGQHGSVWLGAQVSGGVEFCPLTTSGTPSDTSIVATVPASTSGAQCFLEDATGTQTANTTGFSINPGLYLVRVQHAGVASGGDISFADFSGLIVTGASANPVDSASYQVGQAKLVTARGEAGTAVGTDDLGQAFLYVVGGSTDGSTLLDSVEAAPIGLFGDLGGDCTQAGCTFRQLDRTKLPSARAGLQLVARTVANDTTYLYAVGGRDSSNALGTLSRAMVLRNKDAPVITGVVEQAGGSLSGGAYYYRVSAITNDAKNPNGETLPSDEESISVNDGAKVQISWSCVTGATAYNLYRTADPDQVSNTEVFVKQVSPSCTAGSVSTTDTASTTSTQKPLPAGAIGVWVDLSSSLNLATPRHHFAARLVGDDLWVVGGCTNSGFCTSSGSTASIERYSFPTSGDVTTPAAPAAGGSLQQARDELALAVAGPGFANTGLSSYFFVAGGQVNGAELSKSNAANGASVEVALINPGGTLTFPAPNNSTGWKGAPQNVGRAGWAEIVANQAFFELVPSSTTSPNALSSNICGNATCTISAVTDFNFSFNSGFPAYTAGGTRFLGGESLYRAYIYVAGGFPSSTATGTPSGTPTTTVERVVY